MIFENPKCVAFMNAACILLSYSFGLGFCGVTGFQNFSPLPINALECNATSLYFLMFGTISFDKELPFFSKFADVSA